MQTSAAQAQLKQTVKMHHKVLEKAIKMSKYNNHAHVKVTPWIRRFNEETAELLTFLNMDHQWFRFEKPVFDQAILNHVRFEKASNEARQQQY